MIEQIIDLILLFNGIGLIGLVLGLRQWQKRHGRVTEKKLALLLTGYWTFFTLTTFSPLFIINYRVAIIVEIILLLGFWGIGYPVTRWLYRQFNSSSK